MPPQPLGLKIDYVIGSRQQRQLEDFLLQHPEGYRPVSHEQWTVETCMPAIESDDRRALAWWLHGRMISDAVMKPVIDAEIPTIELKNFRNAERTERGLARCMLKQVECEAPVLLADKRLVTPSADFFRIVLDTPSGSEAESFFTHFGFVKVGKRPLYRPGCYDTLMQKDVRLAA